MTIELKNLTTYNKKYVCQVCWPPRVLDNGHYEISGVMNDFLIKLISNMKGCHFRVEEYVLCSLFSLRGVPTFASDGECNRVRLVFDNCILDEKASVTNPEFALDKTAKFIGRHDWR